MTMDAVTMHQRLQRESSSSSTGGAVGNLNGITELTGSFTSRKQIPQPNTGENEEMKNLREEVEDMKEKIDEITQVHGNDFFSHRWVKKFKFKVQCIIFVALCACV